MNLIRYNPPAVLGVAATIAVIGIYQPPIADIPAIAASVVPAVAGAVSQAFTRSKASLRDEGVYSG